MGAMYKRIDRHLYLRPAALRSFILTRNPQTGVAVRLNLNTEIDWTTANLAVLYVVLTINRGIDQYADVLPAVGTFDVLFCEFSHVHLFLRIFAFRDIAKPSRTNPKPTRSNRSRKRRITNSKHPRGRLVIQERLQPMRNERTRVHG